MTNFAFDTLIPTTGVNPSVQYTTMQLNNASTSGLLAIDHVTFNANDGGTHLQLTFQTNNTPISTPSGTQSIVYTAPGVASASSNVMLKNPSGTFLVSCVKAFGAVSFVSPAATLVSGYNVNSVSYSAPNISVTLTSNAVTGNNVIAIVTARNGSDVGYSFSGGVLTITPPANNVIYDFVILQA